MNAISRMTVAVAVALVALAGSARAEVASGVAFEPRTGWYTETKFGVFTTLAGQKMFSNAQPYLGLEVGYDLSAQLSLFGAASYGFNAGSCRQTVEDRNGATVCATYNLEGASTAAPANFSVIPLEIGARYAFTQIVPRVNATVTGVAGYSLLTPKVTETAGIGSPHAGLGAGIAYATRLPGLDVGAEVLVRVAFTPLIPSLGAFARIRYVF